MRFAELRLIKYGNFDSCRLAFPSGEPDLHLVYGPNEAGKTTTLSAIRDLLFGFRHRTDHDYRFDRSLLRVGAVIETDSGKIVVRRKKGEVRTLLDEADSPLADGTLLPLLHGYDAEAFERMFSLDHARLRRGGSEIIAGEGDVGQAIFSAGAGLAGVARLRDDLEKEAKGIWARTSAQDRKYYVAKGLHDGARERLKQALTKPARWDAARREFERAADAVSKTQDAFDRELANQANVERRRRLLLPVAQLTGKRQAFRDLGDVPALPADAGAICQACLSDIEAAKVRFGIAVAAAAAAKEGLAAISVPQELLLAGDEIEGLRESKAVMSGNIADLPKRRATRDAELKRLRVLLSELGWTEEGAADVRSRIPARAKHAEVRELVESRAGLDERLVLARRANIQASEELARLVSRQDTLGETGDLSKPTTALRHLRTSGDLEAAAVKAGRTATHIRTQAEAALQALKPWNGSVEDLRQLALPSEQEVTELSAILERRTREAELAAASVREAGERLADRELELDQALEAGAPVLPEAVTEVRASRDTIWSELRASLLGGPVLDEAPQTVEGYEALVLSADKLSDRRTETSRAAALAIARRQQRDAAKLSLGQAEQREEEASRLREEALLGWRQAVRPVGGELGVAAFQAWRVLAQRALALADQAVEAEAERDHAQSASVDARSDAEKIAHLLGVETSGLTLAALLAQLETRIEALTLVNAERKSVGDQVEAARAIVVRSKRELDAAEKDMVDWTSCWAIRVAAANLGEDASLSLVRARLEVLDEVRSVADRIVDLERRIASMDEAVTRFGTQIDEVAQRAGVRMQPAQDSTVRLAGLSAALATARRLEQERGGIQ
jgi:hypothetical protein